jgi:hypothetical protein
MVWNFVNTHGNRCRNIGSPHLVHDVLFHDAKIGALYAQSVKLTFTKIEGPKRIGEIPQKVAG